MNYTFDLPASTKPYKGSVTIPDLPSVLSPTFTGVVPPTTDPVDPPVPPVIVPGLTGYGKIISFKEFNSLSQDQLGEGMVAKSPTDPLQNVFKAIVRKGAKAISSGFRSEQNWDQTPREGGVEFDAYFEKTFGNALFMQIHGNTDGTSGPVSLWMDGLNKFQVVTSDENHHNKYFKPTNGNLPMGKWGHFRVEFLLADPGYFRVFVDKVKVIDLYNLKTNDVKGQYGKLGVNEFANDMNSGAPGDMVVYYDNFYIFSK